MPTGSPPSRRWIGKALGDETVVNLPAIHSLDELAELDMRETPDKRQALYHSHPSPKITSST
jgi:hypothetical protein